MCTICGVISGVLSESWKTQPFRALVFCPEGIAEILSKRLCLMALDDMVGYTPNLWYNKYFRTSPAHRILQHPVDLWGEAAGPSHLWCGFPVCLSTHPILHWVGLLESFHAVYTKAVISYGTVTFPKRTSSSDVWPEVLIKNTGNFGQISTGLIPLDMWENLQNLRLRFAKEKCFCFQFN